MLKSLILLLEPSIVILVSIVNDVRSFVKFVEALILFFRALFECLEEDIQRNRFGGSRIISYWAFAFWKAFYPLHFRALLRRRSTLV